MGDPVGHIQTVDLRDGLFASRPDYGTQTKESAELLANCFEMVTRNSKPILYIYELSFKAFHSETSDTPDKELEIPDGKKLTQVIRCGMHHGTFNNDKSNIATDFSNKLVSCKKLDVSETGKFKFWAENEFVNGRGQPRRNAIRFQMFFTLKQELQVSDLVTYLQSGAQQRGAYENVLPIIQAFDIILGYRAKLSLSVATPKRGKCFPQTPTAIDTFQLEGPPNTLGYLHGVRGFFASVRATTNRTLVNCNACCGAFYKPGPLKNLFTMFIPNPQSASQEKYKKIESAIQGLRVTLTHLKNEKNKPIRPIRTIFGLARPYGGPREVTFYHEVDKREYTVADYWRMKGYGETGNDHFPVVNVGNREYPTFVPALVCEICAGQMAKKKLDRTQTNAMINNARCDPNQIMRSINMHAFRVLELSNNRTLDSFGISLDTDMTVVQGRVLNQPVIAYRGQTETPQIDRTARWNMRNKRVFMASKWGNWGCLALYRDKYSYNRDHHKIFHPTCQGFLRTLCNIIGQDRFVSPTMSSFKILDRGVETALEEAFVECERKDTRLIVIVLPSDDPGLYKSIKRLGDTKYGIHTVCVLGNGKKFYKEIDKATQYYANIALKINLKLGGINHTLKDTTPLYQTTMVIGIDVTHPSPGPSKRTAPSVAAMVASVDDQLGQWLVDLRINKAGKEMVDLLGPMLKTRLELWKSRHGNSLPHNLLIYRDGVSESQYQAVLQEELSALRSTCTVMYKKNQPKITLIIVGKRHHTRFFRNDGGAYMNPLFGTVVDKGVTEARNWDFFLQSHHALLGTARPAHYFVLLNEIFTREFCGNTKISDYLHKLTYEMCYLFGRSTGPVSIPPPVYYADLACERSRCYGDFDDNMSDTSSMPGDDGGKPGGSRGNAQPPYKGQGSGNKPGPSNQKSGMQGSSKKEDASKKEQRPTDTRMPGLMSGLTKKEREKLFNEKSNAAAQRAAGGSSSTAEGKKSEAKPESKTEGKKAEGKTEGKRPAAESGAKGKGKAAEPEAKGKGKAADKQPDKDAWRKQGEDKTKEVTQSKAQGKKPEPKPEPQKPEAEAGFTHPKEKDQLDIHEYLINTMFYI